MTMIDGHPVHAVKRDDVNQRNRQAADMRTPPLEGGGVERCTGSGV
jgi:hypothetical protein